MRLRTTAPALLLLVVGAGCGPATAGDSGGAVAQPVVSQRVATLDASGTLRVPGRGGVVEHEHALVSADGALAVVAEPVGGTTTARWLSTADGAERAAVTVAGELVPAATDVPGDLVALVSPAPPRAERAIAPARTETEIVVVDAAGEQFRTTLNGNFLPEAFANWYEPGSVLPGSMFVLEFLPAEAPTHYRVRTLSLGDATLGLPLNLRDKSQFVDQKMAGVSRSSLLAADSGLLFTLYRGHHDEGHGSYAFVHALGLADGVWCLLVPPEMQLADRAGAIGLDPSGERLLLVSANGMIAEVATDAVIDITRSPDFGPPHDLGADTDGTPSIVAAGAHVFVGLGVQLVQLDARTLDVTARAAMPMKIDALSIDTSGSVLVAGDGRLLTVGGDLLVQREETLAPATASIVRIVGA